MSSIAGKVAPTFRGAYSAATTYNFYDVVNHDNAMWICKKNGTVGIEPTKTNADNWHLAIDGTVGDAETLEGHPASYFATADGSVAAGDSSKLGGESASAWQTKIDNIQTTSRATLSAAGWYRVAEYTGTGQHAVKGSGAHSCTIIIRRNFATKDNEMYRILFDVVYNKFSFAVQSAKSKVQLIPKIRYTYSTAAGKGYIEVFYNATTEDKICVNITDPTSAVNEHQWWKTIRPTLTEETVEGFTVATTYDIPANASPVTDLDIADLGKLFKRSNWDSSWTNISEADLGIYVLNVASSAITGFPSDAIVNSTTTHHLLVFRNADQNSYIMTEPRSRKIWFGTVYGGDIEWKGITTTADLTTALAGYLKNSGAQTFNGNLTVYASDTTARALGVENSKRRVTNYIKESGEYQLLDITNTKPIIESTLDGTNTFNGTATGNLPLTGGNVAALTIANNEALHKGNSAPVVKSATAPSDTSAVWVDTANKVIKAYIDGAWTSVS